MARYIDAEELMKELESLQVTVTGLRCGRGVLNEFLKEYRKSVIKIVQEQPTADVVEVVRCKDCRNYTDFDSRNCKRLRFHFCNKFHNITREDDFCSYGERKEEKENGNMQG